MNLGLYEGPHVNTFDMWAQFGREIPRSQIRRNDLAYYDNLGHVGVVKDQNSIVHAQSTQNGVVQTSVLARFTRFQRLIWYEVSWEDRIKKFQALNGLPATGRVDEPTQAKAREMKEVVEYICEQKSQVSLKTADGASYVETDSLKLNFHDYRTRPTSTEALSERHTNFANGPFALTNRPIWMVVQDGRKLYDLMAWDYTLGAKGTFIVSMDGHVEVKTLYTIDDPGNVRFAIQGFNLDYMANGASDIFESIERESFDSAVGHACARVGFGYRRADSRVVIAHIVGTAEDLRRVMAMLGCTNEHGQVIGIGVDVGNQNAFVVGGTIVSSGHGLQRYIISF